MKSGDGWDHNGAIVPQSGADQVDAGKHHWGLGMVGTTTVGLSSGQATVMRLVTKLLTASMPRKLVRNLI